MLERAQTPRPVERPAGPRSHLLPVASAERKQPAGLFRIPRGGADLGIKGGEAAYETLLNGVAAQFGIPASLVKAVVKAESGFDPNAVSHAGARGLMQLMPATGRALGVTDPFDPEQNVRAGVRYLSEQISRFGTVDLGLAAYNAGPGAVSSFGGIPPYRETQNYVARVLDYARDYERRRDQA